MPFTRREWNSGYAWRRRPPVPLGLEASASSRQAYPVWPEQSHQHAIHASDASFVSTTEPSVWRGNAKRDDSE